MERYVHKWSRLCAILTYKAQRTLETWFLAIILFPHCRLDILHLSRIPLLRAVSSLSRFLLAPRLADYRIGPISSQAIASYRRLL